eukprot:tig00020830_g14391.t1
MNNDREKASHTESLPGRVTEPVKERVSSWVPRNLPPGEAPGKRELDSQPETPQTGSRRAAALSTPPLFKRREHRALAPADRRALIAIHIARARAGVAVDDPALRRHVEEMEESDKGAFLG